MPSAASSNSGRNDHPENANMPKTWLLVADAAKARLFEIPRKGANPIEIACFTHPDGRTPGQHPEHGRQGRTQESANPARHAIEPHTSLEEKHALQFADLLRDAIRQGRMENQYDQLVLMAPPRFLGVLRDRLDEQTLEYVVAEIGHDLLALSPTELRAYLPT
jgi:protein required for attachment to host cells